MVVGSGSTAVLACVLQRGERRGTLKGQPAEPAELRRLRLFVVGEPDGHRWQKCCSPPMAAVCGTGSQAGSCGTLTLSTAGHANSPRTRGAAAGRAARAPGCYRTQQWPQPAPLAAPLAPPAPTPRHDVRGGARAWVVTTAAACEAKRLISSRGALWLAAANGARLLCAATWEATHLATRGRAVDSAAPRGRPPWERTAAATRAPARPTWRRPKGQSSWARPPTRVAWWCKGGVKEGVT